jgi:hypothetical protein
MMPRGKVGEASEAQEFKCFDDLVCNVNSTDEKNI